MCMGGGGGKRVCVGGGGAWGGGGYVGGGGGGVCGWGGVILYPHALKSTFLSFSLFNCHRYEVPMTNAGRLEVSAG